jgi:hypothetical protein
MDPHSFLNLDPDPRKVNADPKQHWLSDALLILNWNGQLMMIYLSLTGLMTAMKTCSRSLDRFDSASFDSLHRENRSLFKKEVHHPD